MSSLNAPAAFVICFLAALVVIVWASEAGTPQQQFILDVLDAATNLADAVLRGD